MKKSILIAGERRWKVYNLGLDKIPCIVQRFKRPLTLELPLIENIQRESLSAVEKQ